MMRIYNTLTRQLEDFTPINNDQVKIYTCGPTVYDYQHIGNWFTYLRYDLLVRTLGASEYQPIWVLNITDVGHLTSDADEGQDKLEKGATRENKTAWQIADFYTKDFLNGLLKLNISSPTRIPRATQHIDEQLELIKRLEALGFTYVISDGVYYDTSKFPDYPKLAKLDLDNLNEGARVAVNPQKRNRSDFALWKFSPAGRARDMEWDSPWGKGFPGWHIECSAMILKYLGKTIDIHSGGIDHIPIHHTNELAQSQAATGQQLANYWMHTNHILIEQQKISKSLGNGITLQDLEAKGYDLEALRLLCLESHYRTQSKFGWSELDSASVRLKRFKAAAALKWQPVEYENPDFEFPNVYQEILAAMQNDLKTPTAITILDSFLEQVQTSGVNKSALSAFDEFLDRVDKLIGLKLAQVEDLSNELKTKFAARAQARVEHDWQKADNLRQSLSDQGVGINDTSHGQFWFYL